MKTLFQNKVAHITGANVVVSGRRPAEGEAVVEAIVDTGGIASFFRADTSQEAEVKALVEFTLQTYGRLDYAFNNAGVEGRAGLTTDLQTEDN